MAFTDSYRTQHDDILALAKDITDAISRKDPDVTAVRKQLSALAGKVGVHLAMEDQGLYPRLKGLAGTPAAATAARFQADMGGLAAVFTAYNGKWQTSAIRADLPGFANETRKVFGALAHRIQRENTELYPLADNAG